MKVTVTTKNDVEVKTLLVSAKVRYWEDATVNGVEDSEGNLIPCRAGANWEPTIDLQTGQITNWQQGKTAEIHYKVCDCGNYSLLDSSGKEIKSIDGYVPNIMCPKGSGYGDYIIMDIDENGFIQKWKADLDAFEEEA